MSSDYYTKPLLKIFDITGEGDWKRYENEKGFLKFISPLDGRDFSNGGADVYVRDLSFYDGVKLIQVRSLDEHAEPIFYFFLKYNSEYGQLKGDADTIREFNSDAGLHLNIENVFDYLKFFNLFTLNEDGDAFYVIDSQNSEFIKDLSSYEKSRHLRKFNGSIVEDAQEMGVYKISTRILCATTLYDCNFSITSDGEVEMLDDTNIGSV